MTTYDDRARSYAGDVWRLPERGPGSVARFDVRLGAHLLDVFVVGGMALAAQVALHASGLHLTVMVVNLVVLPYLFGGSLGKLALGLRIVPIVHGPTRPRKLRKKLLGGLPDPDRDLAPWRVLVRGLQYPLLLLGGGWYYFSLFFADRDRQTPWDLLARTVVIDTRGF